MKKRILISLCIIGIAFLGMIAVLYFISKSEHTKEVQKNDKQIQKQVQKEHKKEKEEQPVTISFTGDVLFSSYVTSNYDTYGVTGVLEDELLSLLQASDILMVNEEFPFSTRGVQAPDKQYTFRANPKYVSLLQEMGVSVCGLANNHVLDFGDDALYDTCSTLEEAGILYTGAGRTKEDATRLIIIEKNKKKFGFLASSRVIPVGSWNIDNHAPGVFTTYDPTELLTRIQSAKEECDYVFVMVHWGVEHTDVLENYQISMGHQYIDAGADAVIGMHPHVLQGIEIYNGKPIFYSLGNFIFNRDIESTMVVQCQTKDNTLHFRLCPAYATSAKTRLATEGKKMQMIEYINRISKNAAIDENGDIAVTSLD